MFLTSRIEREVLTIRAMLNIYCRAHHGADGALCEGCEELRLYAEKRLVKCPYGEEKPACNHCPIHCYQKSKREEVRVVMRFSGPKIFRHHPVLSIFHLIDKKKKVPDHFAGEKGPPQKPE